MTTAARSSWTRTLFAAALLLQLGGCADPEESDDAEGDHSASSPSDSVGASNEVCYFEYRASYSCSDGDGDPGVWEATCSEIAEDACGGGDFVGTSDYIDGCLFLTEFRSVQWIDADACEAMLPGDEPPDPPPPGTTGGSTDGGSTSGGTTDGGDDPPPLPSVCLPDSDDDACIACTRDACCDELAACDGEPACACAIDCIADLADPTDLSMQTLCVQQCDAFGSLTLLESIQGCQANNCGACG